MACQRHICSLRAPRDGNIRIDVAVADAGRRRVWSRAADSWAGETFLLDDGGKAAEICGEKQLWGRMMLVCVKQAIFATNPSTL